MSDAKKTALDEGQPMTFPRPQGQLHDFPMEYRWEVTRRHPYYLVFWCEARLYHQREMGSDPEQGFLRHAAMLMLGLIGVNGEPVSPGTSFEDLGGCKIDPAFLSGAVQPMTLQAVSVMLINSLPPAERAVLGAILTTSGESEYAIVGDDAARSEQKRQALGRLAQMSSGALDSYPDAPLFYIHLGASLRSIERDLKNVVQRRKQRQGITERRVHTKKLPSSMIPDDMGSVDLRLDLEDLFKQGLSDEEITEKLELDSPDAVAYFRTRLEDFQGI
ncbi:MAG: hypothetical protein IID44_12490 [Planctomycetes bacterium]|nr:hypothetical protein [Planctomycetota bacterium]